MSTFYASPARIAERTSLLLDHARELRTEGILPVDRVELREHRIPLIAEGYFLLNQAYKGWRLPEGHFTEKPKIAALQCVTISRFQPFFPIQYPVNDADVAQVYCNEIFACTYALGILERKFTPDTPEKEDFWLRLLDIVRSTNCETLEPYVTDRNFQMTKDLAEYDQSIREIHDMDKPAINSLICIFELISQKGDILQDK